MLSILGWKTVFVPFSLMRLFFAPKEKPVHPAERTLIMFTLKEFGNRISMLRKLQNLTQDELAERIHVSKDHISRIERGIRACSLESLIDLAQELHTSTDYLLPRQ